MNKTYIARSPRNRKRISTSEIYQEYQELLRHYSNRIFTARLTTMTFIVLAGAVTVGGLQFGQLSSASKSPWVSVWIAAAIIMFWMLELGYFKKYNNLLICLEKFESFNKQASYFKEYTPFVHRTVYFSYFFVSSAFLLNSGLERFFLWPVIFLYVLPFVHMMYISNHWVKHSYGKNIRLDKSLGYSVQFILFGRVLTRRMKLMSRISYILITSIVFGTISYTIYMVKHPKFTDKQNQIAKRRTEELIELEKETKERAQKLNVIFPLQKEITAYAFQALNQRLDELMPLQKQLIDSDCAELSKRMDELSDLVRLNLRLTVDPKGN